MGFNKASVTVRYSFFHNVAATAASLFLIAILTFSRAKSRGQINITACTNVSEDASQYRSTIRHIRKTVKILNGLNCFFLNVGHIIDYNWSRLWHPFRYRYIDTVICLLKAEMPEADETTVARERLCKHVSTETNSPDRSYRPK
jgi:hypothetical protein